MVSFTEYMNKSLLFRQILTTYCVKIGDKAEEIRNHLKMLDCFDTESKNNDIFRNEVFNWFNKKTSTIKLRELSLYVGYDYSKKLSDSNIIDTFDTANIKEY